MIARTLILLCAAASSSLAAAAPADLLETWRAEARKQAPAFDDFSAARGKQLYFRRPDDWSCSTCHTEDPRGAGRHTVTQKPVKPLSPLVNPERFSDAAKTEKWFRRNCRDVLKRECTAAEKGDLLTYLLSAGQGMRP